ncbi:hypothetical protein C439_17258 [Haloferax mediterranei ATCC 33500]|nr:hypothetical protein C439_17258 [Haloferax mediterranei ATCC 33500]
MPFFIGGILGMANEAIDRRTSLQTFVHEGKANYVSLLVVYFGLFAINLVFGVVSVVGLAVGGAFVVGVGGGSQVSLLPLAVIGFVGLLILLAYLTVLFVTQFFGHAIVIDDVGAVNGLKRSVTVVKDNLVSVFGYTIIVTIGGAVVGVLGGLFSLLTTPTVASQSATPTSAAMTQLPNLGLAGIVGLTVLMVLISGLLGGFFAAYSTAFYRSIRPVER